MFLRYPFVLLLALLNFGCRSTVLVSHQTSNSLPTPGVPANFTGTWVVIPTGAEKPWKICSFKNGKLHGRLRGWYANGQLRWDQYYANGEMDGLQRWWDSSGNMTTQEHWKKGKRHGRHREWHEGRPTQDGTYRNGVKDGRWIIWDYWSGCLTVSGCYRMGRPLNGTFLIQEGKGNRIATFSNGSEIEDNSSSQWLERTRVPSTAQP